MKKLLDWHINNLVEDEAYFWLTAVLAAELFYLVLVVVLVLNG